MPVHVDDGHAEREPLLGEAVHQGFVLVLRVRVVTAPPVAQGVAWDERRLAGDRVVVGDGVGVAAAVHEDVQVDAAGLRGHERALLGQREGSGVVEDRDPGPAGHAVLDGGGAVDGVEGAGGAAEVDAVPDERREVVFDGLAVAPDGVVVDASAHRKAGGGGSLAVVVELEIVSDQLQAVAAPLGHDLRRLQRPVGHHLGGGVLKFTVGVPFEPQQGRGEDADAPRLAGDDLLVDYL